MKLRPKLGRIDYTLPCPVFLYFEKNCTDKYIYMISSSSSQVFIVNSFEFKLKRGTMKKTIILLSAFLLVSILAACGGSAPASTADLEPAAPTQAESTPTEVPAATEETVPATEEPATVESEASSAAAVSYANDVYPILEAKCIRCHGIESKKEGLDMLTYDNLIKGSRNGTVVAPGDATNSLFVQLIVEGEMPSRGAKVTPEELQLII
ncbi:MAG: hypothetical protein FJ031_15930, partial [Chloroflexi bacterium]|nr:hypothetical protein [Chloroflexota bacterium]